MQWGVGVVDVISITGGAEVPADGRRAEQRFVAPTGTRIIGALVDRDIGNRDIYWTNYGRVDAADISTETCFKASGEAFCRVKGPRSLSVISASSLAYGVRCDSSWGGCFNGTTLHRVWAIVRSAIVTLDDTEAPVVSAPRGDLADGRWHRGGGSLAFSAEDNTGIRVRRLVEGSRIRASRVAPGAPLGCGDRNVGDAYTYLQPCAGARGLNGEQLIHVADVCIWGDGAHELKALAVDTGGGEALSDAAATVKVDCTPPSVSAGPDDARDVDVGETVAPVISATDTHAGVVETETEVDHGDGSWVAYVGTLTAVEGAAYRFRARATDAAGNVSAWSPPTAPTYVLAAPSAVDDPPGALDEVPSASSTTTKTTPLPTVMTAATPPLALAPVLNDNVTSPVAPLARPAPRLTLTAARRLAGGRKLRVAGTLRGAEPRSTVVVTVRDARRRVRAKRRLRSVRGRFVATLRLPRGAPRGLRVEAQHRTRGGRTITARKSVG